MIDVLLTTWPVPEGHKGIVVDPHEKSSGWIQIKHLVDAGLLTPGTRLTSRQGTWGTGTAIVRQDGLLEVDGKTFETPSGAGGYVKGSVTNGWWFWSLPDGRRLLDVRAAYTGQPPEKTEAGFDWSALHAILEALPAGHWTTYGSAGRCRRDGGSTPRRARRDLPTVHKRPPDPQRRWHGCAELQMERPRRRP